MAFPSLATFYLGLFLIVIGTGLLKGNVSVIVGYALRARTTSAATPGSRSSTWASISGAFFAPLVCGYLGQNINWHLGFAAAGVGMVVGLIQYVAGGQYLGEAGLHPAPAESPAGRATLQRDACSSARILRRGDRGRSASATYTGALPITATQVADAAGYFLLIITVGFFGWLFFIGGWTPEERHRLYAIGVLFLAAALFWSVFEQAGSTLNLFADRNTQQRASRLAVPEQLVPVDELAVSLDRSRRSLPGCGCGSAPRHEPSSPAKFAHRR